MGPHTTKIDRGKRARGKVWGWAVFWREDGKVSEPPGIAGAMARVIASQISRAKSDEGTLFEALYGPPGLNTRWSGWKWKFPKVANDAAKFPQRPTADSVEAICKAERGRINRSEPNARKLSGLSRSGPSIARLIDR